MNSSRFFVSQKEADDDPTKGAIQNNKRNYETNSDSNIQPNTSSSASNQNYSQTKEYLKKEISDEKHFKFLHHDKTNILITLKHQNSTQNGFDITDDNNPHILCSTTTIGEFYILQRNHVVSDVIPIQQYLFATLLLPQIFLLVFWKLKRTKMNRNYSNSNLSDMFTKNVTGDRYDMGIANIVMPHIEKMN